MAELTFNSPIRRDKWPRWMIKLHEYLKKIYEIPVDDVEPDDYDRLKRIIFEKIVALGMINLLWKIRTYSSIPSKERTVLEL